MKTIVQKRVSIIEYLLQNFDKLTFAQQSIVKRLLAKKDIVFKEKYTINYYCDSYSDYSDSY